MCKRRGETVKLLAGRERAGVAGRPVSHPALRGRKKQSGVQVMGRKLWGYKKRLDRVVLRLSFSPTETTTL